MLLTKLRVVAMLILAVGVLAVGAGVLAQPSPGPRNATAIELGLDQLIAKSAPGVPINKTLAKEQVELVQKALDDLNRLAAGGEIPYSNPAFALWGRRKLESLRASGAEKAEIVAGLEEYLALMKKQEQAVTEAIKEDMSPRSELFEVRYRRLEAEIWLNQEKAR